MATTPTIVTYVVTDLSGLPVPSLIATAELLGCSKPYITDNHEAIISLTAQGATSSGAQSTGPAAPGVVVRTLGGSIGAGTYDCLWTYDDGAESLPGDVTTVTTTGSTSSLVYTIPTFPTGAVRAYCYRQKDASGHYYRVGTVDDLTRTVFIDTLAEASITSNPEPASSAPAVGTLTLRLMAPGDITDLANPDAVPLYRITIGAQVFYTTSFAHSGTPLDLAAITAAPATAGIVTKIKWTLIDPSEGPQVGVVSTFAINRTCTATDTGAVILANAPANNDEDDGSNALGQGHIFLKPQSYTSNPTGWYIATLKPSDTPVAFQCPYDPGGHPDGFEWDELTFVALALPGQLIASMANIQAVASNVADTSTAALTTADSGQTEVERIRGQIKLLKGGAVWDVAPSDSSVNIVVGGVLSSQHTGLAIVASAGHLRGRHLAGFPGSRQVTLSAPATAAGSGATLTTITSGVMAGDMHGNGVTLTTGTGPTAGRLFSITFADAYNNLPTLVVKATNAPARQVEMYTVETTSGVDVYARVTPMAATPLIFGWLSAGY